MANRMGYNPDDKVSGYIKFNDAAIAGVLVGGTTRFTIILIELFIGISSYGNCERTKIIDVRAHDLKEKQ